jgi:integrase
MQNERSTKRTTPGIRPRHVATCRSRDGGRCSCGDKFRWDAWVWSPRDAKKLYRTCRSLVEAKAWREESSTGVRKGTMRAPTNTTLREAGEAFIAGAKSGAVRTRSGRTFKPSTVRGYEQTLRDRVWPDLGAVKLVKVERRDVQRLVDRMLTEGLDPRTVRNAIMPLRSIFRRALEDGDVALNPCDALRLPAAEGERDRIASPEEAAELIATLREHDRAVWACAFYAGLRRGELMALRWEDVDLAQGVIRVRRSWDEQEGFVAPKSKAGNRDVPIVALLREQLVRHRLLTARREGFVFGRNAERPFIASNLRMRSRTDWKGRDPIGLHEARHTFASLLIASGVNAKAISQYLGHSSIQVTFDIYGHLMPGNESETVERVDAYLARADTAARLSHLDQEAA